MSTIPFESSFFLFQGEPGHVGINGSRGTAGDPGDKGQQGPTVINTLKARDRALFN